MALATRPKPKAHHRKRQAQHHTHGKLYLKAYWPYLPMLAIIGVGALVNRALYGKSLNTTSAGAVINTSNPVSPSSRIQNLVGVHSDWLFIAALAVTAAAFTFFVVTHWYRLHKLISRGEHYIIRHPWLETSVVLLFTVGFVLTRGAGLPH